MLFPSKVTPVAKSVFVDMLALARFLRRRPVSIGQLLRWGRSRRWSSCRLVQCVEVLYLINMISVTDKGEIKYVV